MSQSYPHFFAAADIVSTTTTLSVFDLPALGDDGRDAAIGRLLDQVLQHLILLRELAALPRDRRVSS